LYYLQLLVVIFSLSSSFTAASRKHGCARIMLIEAEIKINQYVPSCILFKDTCRYYCKFLPPAIDCHTKRVLHIPYANFMVLVRGAEITLVPLRAFK
jgi:hypothetical protein